MSTNTFLYDVYQKSYEQKHNFLLDAILQKINTFFSTFFELNFFREIGSKAIIWNFCVKYVKNLVSINKVIPL